jgi:hypothetical protein
MEEIVPYLELGNQAMKETLEAVLSYTMTAVNRNAFRKTNVVQRLLVLAIDCQVEEKTLNSIFSCLINFAIDDYYVEQCIREKAAPRVFSFLTKNVTPKSSEGQVHNAELIKEKDASGTVQIQIYEIRDGHANFI